MTNEQIFLFAGLIYLAPHANKSAATLLGLGFIALATIISLIKVFQS